MEHAPPPAPTRVSLRGAPALLLLLALLGCGDATAPTAAERAARLRWTRVRPADYTYTLQRGCFCAPQVTSPVIVEVRGGVVLSRRYATSGDAVDPRLAALFPTIDGLFTEIENAARLADHLDAEYDRTYGYPRHVFIDFYASAADDEVALTVSGWRPL